MNFRIFSLFVLLLICDSAVAGTGEVDLASVVDQYKAQSAQFGEVITQAAMWLLVTLFVIEVKWSLVQRWANNDGRFDDVSPYSALGSVLIKNIMRTGFLYWVINGNILKVLVDGFGLIGAQSSGASVAGPGDIFFIGVDIANGLTKGLSENTANNTMDVISGALAAMANILPALIVGLACFFIILAFMVIAAQYTIIMVQLYFFLAIHPLLMAFGAIRFGKDFAAKQFSAAIVIGVRLLAIFFVVAVAGSMGDSLQTGLANLSLDNLTPLWSAVGVAGLLAFMALKLPAMASDIVSGTASLSAGDGIGAATAMGGAAGAIGGATASALMNATSTSTGGFTPLREAVAAASGDNLPNSANGLSPSAGAGFVENNSGSGFSSKNLAPAFTAVENLASAAAMGGDSFGANSGGVNGTDFNSGAANTENSGYKTQSQDTNRAGSSAVSGGSSGPTETMANGDSSGISTEDGSELNSAAPTSNGESLNANSGQAGTDFNSGPAPESGAIEGGAIGGRSSDQSEALADAASVGSGSGFQAEGGSIGGTGQEDQAKSLFNTETKSMADAARDIANEEQAGGGSAHIHMGDD